MNKAYGRAVAAMVVLFVSGSAWAQGRAPKPAISVACDGYGPFTGRADGLTVRRVLLGFTPSSANSSLRTDLSLGAAGLAACDAALSILPEQHWMRRISLLQARAMHRLAVGDTEGALADVALARAAVQQPDDPLFRRSLGLSADLIEAYALRRRGDRAGATSLAVRAWEARPYSAQMGEAALAAMGSDADSDAVTKVVRGMAIVDPTRTERLFRRALEDLRFDEAIALHPSLVPPIDYDDERMKQEDGARLMAIIDSNPEIEALLDDRLAIRAEVFWARNAGALAYAQAATGKSIEARATIAAARARIAAIMEPPRPKTPGGSVQLSDVEARKRSLTQGGAALDQWSILVDRRIQASGASAEQAPAGLTAEPSDPLRDLEALFGALPDPETPKRVPAYGRKANGLTGDYDTYAVTPRPDGKTRVGYRGVTTSAPMVEELALLHAADRALQSGRQGLFVARRISLHHSTTTMMYGVSMGTFHSGFEVKLDSLFVDPQAPPTGYEGAQWRIIDAAEVYRTLGPIYGAPVQPGGR